METFPKTLPELDERIRKAREELNELEFQRNLLVPICLLPAELLGIIFTFCIVPTQEPRLPNVVHVCRLWRMIAFNTPLMWSTPNFLWPKLARGMLRWSKSGPLNIEWSRDPKFLRPKQIEVLTEGVAEISRVQNLHISCDTVQIQAVLAKMVHPAPIMESLTLRSTNASEILLLPDNFLAGDAPCLRRLSLRASNIPWGSQIMKNLTSLDIRRLYGQSRPQTSLAEIIQTLHAMPFLEVLHLDFLSAHDTSPGDGYPVALPKLRRVELISDVTACTALLRRMSFPDTCPIGVECRAPTSHNDDAYDSFFTYMTGLFNTTSPSNNHPRSIQSLFLSFRPDEIETLFITAWNTNEELTDNVHRGHDFGKAQFCCALTLGISVGDQPLPFVQKALASLGSLSQLAALRVTLPVISEDIMIQYFGNLPSLSSIVLQDTCASRAVKALSHNLPDTHLATMDSNGEPSPNQHRPARFPALRILGLFEVNFTSDRDFLVQPLLQMLKLRSQNGLPFEKVVLKACTCLFSPEVAQIREAVHVDWDHQELYGEDTEDEFSEDSDEFLYDSDDDYDDY